MTVEELMQARREFYSAVDKFKMAVKQFCLERSVNTQLVMGDNKLDAFMSMVRLVINSARGPKPDLIETATKSSDTPVFVLEGGDHAD